MMLKTHYITAVYNGFILKYLKLVKVTYQNQNEFNIHYQSKPNNYLQSKSNRMSFLVLGLSECIFLTLIAWGYQGGDFAPFNSLGCQSISYLLSDSLGLPGCT